MAPTTSFFFFFFSFILTTFFFSIPANTHSQFNEEEEEEEGFISVLISQKGLDFAKDILIKQAISSLTPLEIPKIQKSVKIPLIGTVSVVLSNITINDIDVSSSYVKPGDTGVVIVASGATANLSMNWYYSYTTWLLIPVQISDQGSASIQVEGMEVGLTLGLEDQEGTLKLPLMECGCNVKSITIDLDGGASWFYQGLVDAFDGQIRSSVEKTISKKIREGILKLDMLLQTLPKEIPVDDIASLNVTFVSDPLLGDSSIGFEINGLFTATNELLVPNCDNMNSQPLVTCDASSKMIGLSLAEAVFKSGSAVYFNAGLMQWVVDKVPDQPLLNTAGWKYVVPQLYKKYPNDDMKLNISFSSPPVIAISSNKIDATVYSDLTVMVVDANEIIPVACISVLISASGSVDISGNMLVGRFELDDFSLSLKWSKIGKFHTTLIQSVIWSFLRTIATPYVNSRLRKGFPLPIIRGFTIQNADIVYQKSMITICSDLVFTDSKAVM